jgi:hypothetical protein
MLQLVFNGEIHIEVKVNAGIPQGSPVLPMMFLIYISYIFTALDLWKDCVIILFYIDGVAIITSSKSLPANAQRLQRMIEYLLREATDSHVRFDIGKTELIYFYRGRELGSAVIFTAGDIINTVEPKDSVRWLGVWFDRKLTFKEYTEKRAAGALRAFHSMRRLSNITRGLIQRAIRQLCIACVDGVAAYGVPVWWNNSQARIKPFEQTQRAVLRVILGAFRITSVGAMEIEAVIPSVAINFERITKFYGIRVLKL